MALLFEHKVKGADKSAFIRKVKQVAYMLGYDPEWVMFVMNNESGFKSEAINPHSGATGLIQFMPETASWLGTSISELKSMTRNQQLDWVLKYYQKWKRSGKKARNSTDLALITFYPYAVNQPDNYKIGSEKSIERAKTITKQNPGLDMDKDGFISVLDYKKWLATKLPQGVSKEKVSSIIGLKATKIGVSVLSVISLILAGRYFMFNQKTTE
jgi:hypothetical protein